MRRALVIEGSTARVRRTLTSQHPPWTTVVPWKGLAMKLVTMDDEGNVDLSGLARHDRYLAHREPDGTIVLRPFLENDTTVQTLDEVRKSRAA